MGSLTPSEWRSARSRVMEPIHSNIHSSKNTNKAQSNKENKIDLISKQPPIIDNSNINQDGKIAN